MPSDDVGLPKLGGILTGSRKVAVKPQTVFVDIRAISRSAFVKLTARGSGVILLLFDSNVAFSAMADAGGNFRVRRLRRALWSGGLRHIPVCRVFGRLWPGDALRA